MKRFFLLPLCLIPLLSGCMNNFESIFNSADKSILSPVTDENGVILVFNNKDCNGGFSLLTNIILTKMGLTSKMRSWDRDGLEAVAAVINDQSQLENYAKGDIIYLWPEIDFEKYSLVIGCHYAISGGQHVRNQRLVPKKETLQLYLEIQDLGGTANISTNYFGALFPKVSDLPVEVHLWNN